MTVSPTANVPSEMIQDPVFAERGLAEQQLWWQEEATQAELAAQLRSHNFVVIDDFLPPELAASLAEDLRVIYAGGHPPEDGPLGDFELIRGRHTGWLDPLKPDAEAWSASLPVVARRLDQVVRQLRLARHEIDREEPILPELSDVELRGRVMVAVHPAKTVRLVGDAEDPDAAMVQTRFDASVRHTDNDCLGGVGARCNGRRLTVLLYLSSNWGEGLGGKLRVFGPDATGLLAGWFGWMVAESAPQVDLAPKFGRLVLMWSDNRAPHLVTPIGRAAPSRMLMTAFYYSAAELAIYNQTGSLERLRSFKRR